MTTTVEARAEENRKQVTGDNQYAAKGLFLFVLNGPAGQGPFGPGQTRLQFPLIINPTDFDYGLPFAANLTVLQEGGVTSEENGIVIGEISMEGTTGFKLRRPGLADNSSRRSDGEFTSDLNPSGNAGQYPLSGHMHFWRLANRCFDGYSALKKNPATASRTTMEFHSLKDDLHLLVVPLEFNLSRSGARERVTYRYSIRLAVVGAAKDIQSGEVGAGSGISPSPDRKLLDRQKNTVAKIRSAIQDGKAHIDNLRAAQDEIRRKVVSTAGILDDAARVFDSAQSVLDGTRRFLDFPKVFASSLNGLIDSAADFINPDDGEGWRGVGAAYLGLADNIDRLLSASLDLWTDSLLGKTNDYEKRTIGYQQGQDTVRDGLVRQVADDAVTGQTQMTVAKGFGGSVQPGDVRRGQNDPIEAEPRFQPNRYKGYRQVVVGQGDTIQSLAAKHIGNPNEWAVIAVVNALRAPYVTGGVRLPNTLAPGDSIMIPIPEALSNPDTFTTGNPATGGNQIDALLGTDFERHQNANGQFGWAIDTAGGSTDVRKIKGVANLSQGLDGRLRTNQGENILYPQVGMPRQVGTRSLEDATETINTRYLIRRQFLADARVERLVSLQFIPENDQVKIEAEVQPVGFTSTRTIARTLT
jgi:hypothetical protein